METGADVTTWRAMGLTDDITTCDHCGRADLKATVRMVAVGPDGDDDGDTYMGVVCAARMTGRKAAGIRTEAQRADRARDQAIRDTHRAWLDRLTDWHIAQRTAALGTDASPRACMDYLGSPEHRAAEAVWLADNPRPPAPAGY
jgi:hypothetical protein